MAFIGRLHPVLIHFPIVLVIVAVVTESAFLATRQDRWRTLAVFNIRTASVFAVIATLAGWWLAEAPDMDAGRLLDWHRWVGTAGAALAVVAAALTARSAVRSRHMVRVYRVVLFGAGTLIGVAGHLGGVMVWGAGFLRLWGR